MYGCTNGPHCQIYVFLYTQYLLQSTLYWWGGTLYVHYLVCVQVKFTLINTCTFPGLCTGGEGIDWYM